jgi:hypothetical protein
LWSHALLALGFVLMPLAAGAEPGTVCDASRAFAYADDLSGFVSPCSLAPGKIGIDAVYLQNASSVGGTALAAFPMIRLRGGIAPRLQLLVDAPAQVAESKPGGGGNWPITHAGYGIDYTFLQTRRLVIALQSEVLPPGTPWVPSQSQPKYQLGLASDFQITSRFAVGVTATGRSSGAVGFERILPGLGVRTAFDLSPVTQVVTDLGTRITDRHLVAQSIGDIAVNERLSKNVLFNVGLGTSFNAVGNAKVHYLASGMSYRY